MHASRGAKARRSVAGVLCAMSFARLVAVGLNVAISAAESRARDPWVRRAPVRHICTLPGQTATVVASGSIERCVGASLGRSPASVGETALSVASGRGGRAAHPRAAGAHGVHERVLTAATLDVVAEADRGRPAAAGFARSIGGRVGATLDRARAAVEATVARGAAAAASAARGATRDPRKGSDRKEGARDRGPGSHGARESNSRASASNLPRSHANGSSPRREVDERRHPELPELPVEPEGLETDAGLGGCSAARSPSPW